MASFDVNDIEGLILSMEEMARMPDEVIDDILEAGAEVVRKAHVRAIDENFDKHTGALIGSPGVVMKRSNGKRYALVYPQGKHHTYRAKKGKGEARNADVGFVLEYGGHGNRATNWMRNANEKCADEMTEAEAKVYDEWLKSINL